MSGSVYPTIRGKQTRDGRIILSDEAKGVSCEREGYCEVVQWGEGVRIHPALHGRGRVRAFLGHPGERLPLAERRRDRRVRSARGPERVPGGQRRARGIEFSDQFANPLSKVERVFCWSRIQWAGPPFAAAGGWPFAAAAPPLRLRSGQALAFFARVGILRRLLF